MFCTAAVYSPFPTVVTAFLLSRCDWWKEILKCANVFWSVILCLHSLMPSLKFFYHCQKGDPCWHHHGVSNILPPWSSKFSPLFKFFYQSGMGFQGVVDPHHFYVILFYFNSVYRPLSWEYILKHSKGEQLSKYFQILYQGVQEYGFHHRDDLLF